MDAPELSSIRLTGVVGWPLVATLSPVVHNAAFTELGLPWVYTSFPIPPDALGRAIDGARALGLAGFNVTIPYKEEITPLLDGLEGEASSTQAVNTVVARAGRLIGFNTDVTGFTSFLEADAGLTVEGRQVLVLGAGGAARAVVRGLAMKGAARIAIAARDDTKAARVVLLAQPARGTVHQWVEAPWLVHDCELIVNTTPESADAVTLLRGELGEGQSLVDLNYMPEASELVLEARRSGAQGYGGLGMLVRQAAAAFELWTGRPAPLEVMSAAATSAAAALARPQA